MGACEAESLERLAPTLPLSWLFATISQLVAKNVANNLQSKKIWETPGAQGAAKLLQANISVLLGAPDAAVACPAERLAASKEVQGG